jgi:thiol-disulfide isomerase/thioredoxin
MTTDHKAPRKFPLVPVIVGVFAIALVALVVVTFDQGGTTEFGDPVVTGDSLPFLPDGGTDPALGIAAPEVTGTDYDDSEVSITHDGNSKIVLFVAHWCPHCQREVPLVQEWLDSAPLPDNVELISVSTSISSTAENYPPSAWLEREGWTSQVIVDNAAGDVANAFGLTAFPYWVFMAGDGTVLARVTGGIAISDLDTAVATLQTQASG